MWENNRFSDSYVPGLFKIGVDTFLDMKLHPEKYIKKNVFRKIMERVKILFGEEV